MWLLQTVAKKKKTGATLKTDAQDRSSPVRHTQVCAEIPQRCQGRNRAQQVRLSELLHISEIEINTNLFGKLIVCMCVCVGSVCCVSYLCICGSVVRLLKGGGKSRNNELCFVSLLHILPEVAVMNRCTCTSQSLIITVCKL